MKSIILWIFPFLLSLAVYSQNCNDYHLKHCEGCGKPYKFSGQSRSTSFEKGQTSVFHITVFKDFEYCVQICSAKNLKNINFKIKEDNITKDVLYDSSVEDNNYLEKEFTVTKTRKLLIEVIVPESEVDASQEEYKDRIGCVGVLLEYNRPNKKGFD